VTTDPRVHSFGLRVVEAWNALSDDMKSPEKIQTFKSQLRREGEQRRMRLARGKIWRNHDYR
jgi:hypothetical protein